MEGEKIKLTELLRRGEVKAELPYSQYPKRKNSWPATCLCLCLGKVCSLSDLATETVSTYLTFCTHRFGEKRGGAYLHRARPRYRESVNDY